ncbi:MAG TPA: fluoride efflux transporter CrcB [Gammaproteobacteria bacterium]
MSGLLAVAFGGACGALLRYGVANGVHGLLGRAFPYGTLTVNVSGCLLVGLLYVHLIERSALAPEWRLGLLVGVLGAFTTFSSFALETLALVEQGEPLRALVNILASVVTCLVACWLGLQLGRSL